MAAALALPVAVPAGRHPNQTTHNPDTIVLNIPRELEYLCAPLLMNPPVVNLCQGCTYSESAEIHAVFSGCKAALRVAMSALQDLAFCTQCLKKQRA